MKKVDLKSYSGVLGVIYCLFTLMMVEIFFCYVTVTDRINEEIQTKEIELQYALDSRDEDAVASIQELLTPLKERYDICTALEVKYLVISSVLMVLLVCWYKFFRNRSSSICIEKQKIK